MKALITLIVTCSVSLLLNGCAHRTGSEPTQLTVMSYNIHHGRGIDGEVDLERIAKLIRDTGAELVALQEVDKGTQRTNQRDLAAELAELTGMKHVFEKNIDFQGGEYGNAILSRFPITDHANQHYKMLRDGEQRGILSATIRLGDREITFASTHLDHRSDPSERLSNVEELRSIVENAGVPIIIAGDFNDTPGKEVHTQLREFLTDTWELSGGSDGFTFSSDNPRSRIDYVWVAPAASWQVFRAKVLTSEASDHLPLVVDLVLNNE